jgi:hypothetical protein
MPLPSFKGGIDYAQLIKIYDTDAQGQPERPVLARCVHRHRPVRRDRYYACEALRKPYRPEGGTLWVAGNMLVMKRLLVLALLLAVAVPAQASAAGTPCRNKVFNDWYPDGKIASSYPVGCYRDALKHLPSDAAVYSSLSEDVRAAMRAAMRRSEGLSAPAEVGHGPNAIGAGSVKGALASINTAKQPTVNDRASTGVVASASGAPLPILLLGGIALALVAAGGIGAGVRHARSRRR